MSSRHRTKHRRKSGGLFGLLVKLILLVLIVGGAGVFLVKFAPSMLSSKFNSTKRFNVVLTAPSKTAFVSLDGGVAKATVINFPEDLYITNVAHGYGQYPIGKVFEVGQLDGRGGQVLSDTIRLYLGVPVDGFTRFSDFDPNNLKGTLVSTNFIFNPNSNLNLWDRVLLAKAVFDLRFDKVTEVNLSKKSEELLLADGSKANILVPEDVDNLLHSQFTEDKLLREAQRVQIINTTETPGLGNAFARIVSNLGATVIDVTTGENIVAQCEVQGTKDSLKTKTATRLTETFECKTKLVQDTGRADLIMLLGTTEGKIFVR